MDLYAMLTSPVEAVFGLAADPSRLGDWLGEVAAVPAGPAGPAGSGAEFSLTLHDDTGAIPATGEMTAFEPPWLIGYRLFAGSRAHGLRVTCTAQGGGTRIHVHQPNDVSPLTVDLARFSRALAAAGRHSEPEQ